MNRFVVILLCLVTLSCSPVRKVEALKSASVSPSLTLSEDIHPSELSLEAEKSDTMRVVDANGQELLIMKAVRDADGDMVASDVIAPSLVVATFRNVAERNGKVDLRFDITVPASMVDSRWQIRICPRMYILGDSLSLEPLYITGALYRNRQLRGYDRYRRFLDGIITDSLLFVDMAGLEIFLRRNIPQLYAMKNDTSIVSDEEWKSIYGVGEKEAVDHYTNRFRKRINGWKSSRKDRMFKRLVKAPIVKEGLRLDTVVTESEGDVCYHYVQTIKTRPGLRKVEVELLSSIYEADRLLGGFDGPGMLTFYISSLSTLVDDHTRYKKKIVERRVEENAWYDIGFSVGSNEVDSALGNNAEELCRIKDKLRLLQSSEELALDSITVEASCSPEGSLATNAALSKARSNSVCDYFSRGMDGDTLCWPFRPNSLPENWAMLSELIAKDSLLIPEQKKSYEEKIGIQDLDKREKALSKESWFSYVREMHYPKLRAVRFGFHLHRKGMVKDTIWTKEPDTLYMKGVQAIKDRDYSFALQCLSEYGDWNTALAYCALDRNASALKVLESLPDEAKVDYMKAIIHSRRNEEKEAIQCYLNACERDGSYVHRANLDPEISSLIKKYQLNNNK